MTDTTTIFEVPTPTYKDVHVPMRDGGWIAADVFLPEGNGPFPTLFAISPYGKDLIYCPPIPTFRWRETGDIAWWLEQGYAFVHADTRGMHKSTHGTYRSHDIEEQQDSYDTIEWIAEQKWSTGKVGMIGESYLGVVQWFAAALNPPHLSCIAPYDACIDLYRDMFFHGGILAIGFLNWTSNDIRARVLHDRQDLTDMREKLAGWDAAYHTIMHPNYDDFWKERSAYEKLKQIKVPVYSITNWNSVGIHLRGNILAYEMLDAPKKLLVNGGPIGDPHIQITIFNSREFSLELKRWYDYWLKGIDTGIMDEPPVTLALQPGGKVIRQEAAWPLARAEYRALYLSGAPGHGAHSLNDGSLTWEAPTAAVAPTAYRYPQNDWGGWPGIGTAIYRPGMPPDPVGGILTFTSAPLEQDLEITGPIVLRLWASSDQTDSEFICKIFDQPGAPEGTDPRDPAPRSWIVTRGWLRASHRALDPDKSTPTRPFHPHKEREPLTPGEVYAFEIEVWPTSWLFKAGHRIRLDLANGDSPALDAPFTHHYGLKIGVDQIHHDPDHPSHLWLPIVPS